MKKKHLFMGLFCLIAYFSCSDDKKSDGEPYDPSKPAEITTFMPDTGRIREKFIIKGTNFGTDKSKVEVYFKDNDGSRKATVIGIDNSTIYCLAPRQLAGNNKVEVIIDGKTSSLDKTFHYIVAENVSTIAGKPGTGGTDDGTLVDARFSYIQGIGALGDETVIVFQRDNPAVRLVSVKDNKVITLQNAFQAGKPAVSKDKARVYAAGQNSPHVIYMYTKESGWSHSRIGQLGTDVTGIVRALAFDETEEWLYFCDATGKFGRYNIKTQERQILNEKIRSGTSDVSYLAYSAAQDCFYWSAQSAYGIYKISKDGQTVEAYAGFNGNAYQDGYVQDAKFVQPNGLTIDEDGNIYITEGHGGHIIRKISIKEGYVSTIAGTYNAAGNEDGSPLTAKFNYPYDISYDGEGGYWICEGWGVCIRKYAVE